MTASLRPLKTWSHLAARRRRPSEYEIVSTNLHWHLRDSEQPWDVAHEGYMADWYRRYRNGSPVRHDDWDSFRDPDELVYRSYNILQDGQENYVEGLLSQHNEEEHDKSLDSEWVTSLGRLYAPGRYLLHTVQMASAYLVHMAPASTISNCAAFQAADQLRWLSHTAYRTAELAQSHPSYGLGSAERALWEELPAWQRFRELMECVLATRDWAESFVALNLVAKPAIDEAFYRQQGISARRHGDTLFALMAEAALRDSERSRRWAVELVRTMAENPDNVPVVKKWLDRWVPLADAAIDAFCAELPDNPEAAATAIQATRAFRNQLPLGS
ncbi:aromatic/alkene monooxygenase hydroxylase subunit beta [Nocardia africana]|uniref:propane 2-monooxygenase n=1 Tax=Nocardia africana TaxID=134964 RepID=A0A378WND7_9NOCA|nr:aromatic/alkene monooxygenase hydroxylase subunit beta [Nocardia africana]MCC3314947.1 aromatic/alkene monooxygenase hydroxylase subunit beta [Nocardia africana]SUA42768.1 Toluene-4-monooxygenase system protein E [Nocardia africana]